MGAKQINFTRRKRVFLRVVDVAFERETEESIILSGNYLTHVSSGRGKIRGFLHPNRVNDIEFPIKYKDRIRKLLDENPQEPVEFVI